MIEHEHFLRMKSDAELQKKSVDFFNHLCLYRYSYHFQWGGRPIIQFPQDIIAMQEIIWTVRPDLIIETGIAHGGSLAFSASMLALLDYCDAAVSGQPLDPHKSKRRVIGVDIDIREHNRVALDAHPLRHLMTLIQGSSVASETISKVKTAAVGHERVLVCLDSNHTHDHVLAELNAYAPLVSPDSYCVVFDTVIENMPSEMFPDRPWSRGNNPKTAVLEYLKTNASFEIDNDICSKLMLTVAPDGYLKRKSL